MKCTFYIDYWSLILIVLNTIIDPFPASESTSIRTPLKLKTRVIKSNSHSLQPISTTPSDYYNFVLNSRFFVDNSLLIEYIIEGGITVLVLPRGFGKSTNLNMIKSFVQIEVDPVTGRTIPKNETKAYQLFESRFLKTEFKNVALKPNFLIKERPKSMLKRNTFPVVHLNLGNPGEHKSLEGICNFIVLKTGLAFDEHSHYLMSSKTPAGERFRYALSSLNRYDCAKNPYRLSHLLHHLFSSLHLYFQKPVILLIDEYDAVLNKIFIDSVNVTKNFRDDVVKFFVTYYGTLLKDNNFLQAAALTGIISWKYAIFSELQHVSVKTIADNEPLECYGFSPSHVKDMLKAYNNDILNETVFKEIERLYDGYIFGGVGQEPPIKKFNPASIAMFFKNKQWLQGYWSETGDIGFLLRQLIKYENFIHAFLILLLENDLMISTSHEYTSISMRSMDFQLIADLIERAHKLKANEWYVFPAQNIHVAFYLLYATGYLTKSERCTRAEVSLKIPNREVLNNLWRAYDFFLTGKTGLDNARVEFATKMRDFSEEYGNMIRTNKTDCRDLVNRLHAVVFNLPLVNRYLNEKLTGIIVLAIHYTHYSRTSLEIQGDFKQITIDSYQARILDLGIYHEGRLTIIELMWHINRLNEALKQTSRYETIAQNHPKHSEIREIKIIGFAVFFERGISAILKMADVGKGRLVTWKPGMLTEIEKNIGYG